MSWNGNPSASQATVIWRETGTPETERIVAEAILQPSTFHSSDKAKAAKLMHKAVDARRDA
jgi:hypothetical protein